MVSLQAQTTVRAAKTYVKRVHPKGGTILGYIEDVCIYVCVVDPQHLKGKEGRSVYSDRLHNQPEGTYVKPETFFFVPDVFDYTYAVEKPDGWYRTWYAWELSR